MKKNIFWTIAIAFVVSFSIGCDTPPTPPAPGGGSSSSGNSNSSSSQSSQQPESQMPSKPGSDKSPNR